MDTGQQEANAYGTVSTGSVLASADWLDTHFEVCRAEYEAQVHMIGIEPGWRVLDAAAGSGSFLPCLAALVGETGQLAALDLAPENLDTIEERLESWALPCPVELHLGDVRALPYPDAHFDAVWFANTAQYFGDDELLAILAEFRRVVRPGGLVAVKDSTGFDALHPLPPFLFERLSVVVGESDSVEGQRYRNVLCRTAVLQRWLERAGFVGVWQRYTAIERWAPFAAAARQFLGDGLSFNEMTAARYDIAVADRATWARVSDPTSGDNPINHPEGYFREGNILSVGRVPEA